MKSENFDVPVIYAIFVIAVTMLLAIPSSYVALCLYRWFVLPAFGLPILTLSSAYGVLLLVSFTQKTTVKKNDDLDLLFAVSTSLAKSLLYYCMGILTYWLINN